MWQQLSETARAVTCASPSSATTALGDVSWLRDLHHVNRIAASTRRGTTTGMCARA